MTLKNSEISFGKGLLSISPIFVFLAVYLVTSLILGDFYKIPISVAMLIASIWAALLLRGQSLKERIEIFSGSAGNSNV
ncbi:MAG: Na+/H+ antiporter NhaC family protein, partial [Muribaculaceae bacterium]|nr:Na+/H+ antiporter NhaC family protein [Muribaculaceae bacterium]